MVKAQYTPGPWNVGAITEGGHNIQVRAKKGNTEFECCPAILGGWDTTKEENLANARLIAAAPEMHKELSGYDLIISDYENQKITSEQMTFKLLEHYKKCNILSKI